MKDCVKTGDKSVGENAKPTSWLGRIIGLAVLAGVIFWVVTEAYPKMASQFTAAGPAAVNHPMQGPAATPPPAAERWITVHLLGWWHWSADSAEIEQNGPPFEFFVPKEGAKVQWADGSTTKLVAGRAADLSGHFGTIRFKGPKGERVFVCLGAGCEKESHAPREVEYPQSTPTGEEQRLANDDSCDSGSCPYRR